MNHKELFCFLITMLVSVGFFLTSFVSAGEENLTADKMTSTQAINTETDANVRFNEMLGPTIKLRALNSVINKTGPGSVDLFVYNPILNKENMTLELTIDVPSNTYIESTDGVMAGGAGTVVGLYNIQPAESRTIHFRITGQEKGHYGVDFIGKYWRSNNQKAWKSVTLTAHSMLWKPHNLHLNLQ